MKEQKPYETWYWKEDISTWFTAFVTVLGVWLVCISLMRIEDMSQTIQNIANIIAIIGTIGLPIFLIPIVIWLCLLMRRKARGTLKTQRIEPKNQIIEVKGLEELVSLLREQSIANKKGG